jgi:hypothetical protein
MAVESRDHNRELRAILLHGYESKDVDYKCPMSWNEDNKKACCALVKDILGFANTNGGFIVLGVSDRPSGFSFDGLSPEQTKTFDTTRLNRFLQNYCDPPINALLRKIDHDGKNFVIIEVPGFPDTPHICQKDYPGALTSATLYVRTDNNETAPIRSSSDFRALLERALRNRSDTLLASVRSILKTGVGPEVAPMSSSSDKFAVQRSEAAKTFEEINPPADQKCAGYFEMSFFPDRFERSRFTLDQLRAAAKRGEMNYRGWPFLYVDRNAKDTYVIQHGIQTSVHKNIASEVDLVSFWQFQQSGFFYQRTSMSPDPLSVKDAPTRCVVDFRAVAMYAAEAIHCLSRLYEGLLDPSEEVSLVWRLLGTQGRVLTSSEFPLWADYTSRMPEIVIERQQPLADWRAGIVDHAVEVSNEVYLSFNWPNPGLAAARDAIQKMFERRF